MYWINMYGPEKRRAAMGEFLARKRTELEKPPDKPVGEKHPCFHNLLPSTTV
jgi:hypothetical protein